MTQVNPAITIDSDNLSDCDSSDERSQTSKTSDEDASQLLEFRPTHSHLKAPELKRSASNSSISSYASSSPPETPSPFLEDNQKLAAIKSILDENRLALGESGSLAQNWFSCGNIRADGRWFKDDQGRTCLLRGVNLCGNSKLPTKPDGSSHLSEGFFDHRNVSFIGRPFPREEVDQHFARLRTWGLTFVRLLVTWESLEHSGPGIYDEEFIDYLIFVIEKMSRYGIKCFIDPHQDCWSRFSGGSGAPGWTFEVAGLDMTKFKSTGAAYVHNTNHKPDGSSLPMVWPTNYTKLASSTMFTLFWGGDVFAPNTLYEGVNIKDFLQEKFVNCYKNLARRLQHLEAVVGFELINEPHQGYIGLADMNKYDGTTTLVFGDSPSALQSFALGYGIPQEIEVWVKSWPYPTKKDSTHILNKERDSAWLNGECIWRQHGVWDVDSATGNPKILRKDYFTHHPNTGKKLDYYKDFYLPFVKKYSEGIQSVKKDYYVFVEPLPNEPPPTWTEHDHHENIIYAPHWYDLKSLFNKTFNGMITHDVQRLTKGAQHIVSATYFGISGAKKNYTGQVRNIMKHGLQRVGEKPCIIGECGIPMDINEKKAFEDGDYTHHSNFLDAVLGAMERNLVNFTLWNYNPLNDNKHGDHCPTSPTSPISPFDLTQVHFWEQEDSSYDHYHHQGGRVLDARPYAAKTPGEPTLMTFNLKTLEFIFKFKNDPTIKKYATDNESLPLPETEFYIPNYHYKNLILDIRVSDGDWRYVKSSQTLYWRVKDWTTEGITHSLRIRVVDKGNVVNEKEDTLSSSTTVTFGSAVAVTVDSSNFKIQYIN
ncbi:16713_t:CDS:10 [Entrophospora sp. SA101]|nr:16713_t:CDS:10 [Entrophospora sp. SA101]